MEWFDPFYTEVETLLIDKWAPVYPVAISPKQWRPEGIYAYTEVPVVSDVVDHGWEFWMPQIQRRYMDRWGRLFGTMMMPQVQDPIATSYITLVGETWAEPTYGGTYGVIPSELGETTFNTEGE